MINHIIPNSVQCKKCKEVQTRSKQCVYCGNDITVTFTNDRNDSVVGGVYV